MAANNMQQLNAMMLKELRKAMSIVEKKSLADMYDETGKFYTSGNPKMYQRTGALGDTPKTTSLTSSQMGNSASVSFEAYLDTSHSYTTGANPNMQQVLELANDGTPFETKNGYPAKPTLGKKGFWQESEKKIKKELDDTLGKFFK